MAPAAPRPGPAPRPQTPPSSPPPAGRPAAPPPAPPARGWPRSGWRHGHAPPGRTAPAPTPTPAPAPRWSPRTPGRPAPTPGALVGCAHHDVVRVSHLRQRGPRIARLLAGLTPRPTPQRPVLRLAGP